METYFENLREYILEKHPNVSDAESVLEMIYECYAQLNQMDNETIRKDFDELYQAMHGHSLKEIDKVIYTVCLLCRDYKKSGFVTESELAFGWRMNFRSSNFAIAKLRLIDLCEFKF